MNQIFLSAARHFLINRYSSFLSHYPGPPAQPGQDIYDRPPRVACRRVELRGKRLFLSKTVFGQSAQTETGHAAPTWKISRVSEPRISF